MTEFKVGDRVQPKPGVTNAWWETREWWEDHGVVAHIVPPRPDRFRPIVSDSKMVTLKVTNGPCDYWTAYAADYELVEPAPKPEAKDDAPDPQEEEETPLKTLWEFVKALADLSIELQQEREPEPETEDDEATPKLSDEYDDERESLVETINILSDNETMEAIAEAEAERAGSEDLEPNGPAVAECENCPEPLYRLKDRGTWKWYHVDSFKGEPHSDCRRIEATPKSGTVKQ